MKKVLFAYLSLFGVLFADNSLLSQIETSSVSLISQILKVMGNIGAGVAILSIAFICFAAMGNNERLKSYINHAVVVFIIGGTLKLISTLTSFSGLF